MEKAITYKEQKEDGIIIKTEKEEIRCLYYRNKDRNKQAKNFVILMSHANSTNISKMRYYNMYLGMMLKVDVLCYEYRGYSENQKGIKITIIYLYNVI